MERCFNIYAKLVDYCNKNHKTTNTTHLLKKHLNNIAAGTGILFVGLYHPRGPSEEVQTKHTGKNNYTVNYYIRERSDYVMVVLWNEAHIPGSPFSVEVSLK